jgi:site-specific DNA-methyltransferase (adenine-specific)
MPAPESKYPPPNLSRMPKSLQAHLEPIFKSTDDGSYLDVDRVHHGDARALLPRVERNSIALSVWSPPYFVGKSYEADLKFSDWQSLLREVIKLHWPIINPGGFLVINIADILCFADETMPKIQAQNVTRHRSPVSREDVLRAQAEHPEMNRSRLAALLNCSEQTIDRRLNGNNIRGGKYETQTRVKIVGGMVEEWALAAGFFPYDRRVWVKDPCWENSKYSTLSYRAVDEFEYLYFFWKPGVTNVNRTRLTEEEWSKWGYRAVWEFPSVRANDDHEAKFPEELPRRVIKLLTDPGETVLDCFMGSGTTAVAAIKLDRRFIGVEVNKDYVDLARERISQLANGNEPEQSFR